MKDATDSEIEFLLSMRCWVYPFCYVPPDPKKCYRILASGLKCDSCKFRIMDKRKAERYYAIYQSLMAKREQKHYDFLKTEYWKKKVRPMILEYDNHQCVICGKALNVDNAHIHHIIDFSADEDISPSNLVTLCKECHAKLHPVFPYGMWALGWPNLNKVKQELKAFYKRVKEVSKKNKNRFKAPLEHLMMHICLICPQLQDCNIGKFTLNDISATMDFFVQSSLKKCNISDLKEGMSHLVVEGRITSISPPKEVETRYGKTKLAVARLKDETGEIRLNLFGEQIEKVKVGDEIIIENAYTLTYEGNLTLNIPKIGGKIMATKKNVFDKNRQADKQGYPYHKIITEKLEGSYEGKFSRISILGVYKNHQFECPKHCFLYPNRKECIHKQHLMINPAEDILVCTIIYAEIESLMPADEKGRVLCIREGENTMFDSKGISYGLDKKICYPLIGQARQKFGTFFYKSQDPMTVPLHEGTKVRVILVFPQIPEKEEVGGLIINLWRGYSEKIETFHISQKKRR